METSPVARLFPRLFAALTLYGLPCILFPMKAEALSAQGGGGGFAAPDEAWELLLKALGGLSGFALGPAFRGPVCRREGHQGKRQCCRKYFEGK